MNDEASMVDAASRADGTLELPYRFGSYLLFDRIGVGGMAEIFLARGRTQVGATRLAVVKLVLPSLAGEGRFADMLIAEAKLAAQLSHASVVQTYDLGREAGRLYIAMEYVEGFDLNELLRRCTKAKLPLPAEFVFHVMGETLRALDYAHRRKDTEGRPLGIVHRDVSPSNVLISFEGEVKLCDFGIARAVNVLGDASADAIEGKASYMSPEHARGEVIDGRADVFAASIVLWELLCGRRLYKPAQGQDALALARAAEIPPMPDRGLPDQARLERIVLRGLHRDPHERYPTALAMARELDAYAADNQLITSPLRIGAFLTDHFGAEIIEGRRSRERAAAAFERGPLLKIEVVSFPETARPVLHVPPPTSATTERLQPTSAAPPPRGGFPFAAKMTLAGLAIAAVAASAGWLLARH